MSTSKNTKQGSVNKPSAQGQHSKIPPPDPDSPVPVDDRLPATIELAELKQSAREHADGSARITNSQYLTSYNWEDMYDDTKLEYCGPTILIPGKIRSMSIFAVRNTQVLIYWLRRTTCLHAPGRAVQAGQ